MRTLDPASAQRALAEIGAFVDIRAATTESARLRPPTNPGIFAAPCIATLRSLRIFKISLPSPRRAQTIVDILRVFEDVAQA